MRIQKEINNACKLYGSDRVNVVEDEKYGSMLYLKIKIEDGMYKGQNHVLEFKFKYGNNQSYAYPRNPPLVTFKTPIFHPNISEGGAICVDILKQEAWSPLYGIEQIYSSIIILLDEPDCSSPLNSSAAKLYMEVGKKEFGVIVESMNS